MRLGTRAGPERLQGWPPVNRIIPGTERDQVRVSNAAKVRASPEEETSVDFCTVHRPR